MPEYGQGHVANIIGSRKIPSADRGERFRAEKEGHGTTRAGAIKYRGMTARFPNDLADIFLHARFHPHFADRGPAVTEIATFAYYKLVLRCYRRATAPA